jgi:hypothetical protein
MATITANLSSISGSGPSNNRTATFSQGSGAPSWASVKSDGEIDANGPGAAAADVVFNLPADSPVTFMADTPFSPVNDQFSVIVKSDTSITVHDNNTRSGQYEYTLYFSDGTSLDPRFINR